jgi:hypothetical protein
MKKNMGILDRIIRTLIAVVIVILFYANVITGTLAIVLLVISGIFLIASLIGFCPLYLIFGINTKKKGN